MSKYTLFTFLLGLTLTQLNAQEKNNFEHNTSTVHIRKAVGKIILDGKLDEETWQTAEQTTPFIQSLPYDTSFATGQTEVKVAFDETNLYVGAKCYQKKERYVVQSLKRDFQSGTTDVFAILLDPFGDRRNGLSFGVSPLGVQREGLVANGNEFSTDWDNRWFSKVGNYPDFYIVEMAIPFKSLRYKTVEGVNEWLVNFIRFNQSQKQIERSNWSFIPRFSNGSNVIFSGHLIWDDAPPKPSSQNIAFVPYLLGAANRDFENKKPTSQERGIGFDAKVALSSSLNLDLTVNPDFAQVEVDKQQTNLSRFELFFPERRQFFVENSDLFGSFGTTNMNPFFSRRIGLANDSAGNAVKVPIIAGARLTGKLDKNWRIGLLDVQTKGEEKLKIAASNFLATAIQRRVFSRSNVGFIFVNKQDFKLDSTGKNTWNSNPNSFNRLVGVDYDLASANGKWKGKAFYHHSLTPTLKTDPFAASALIEYSSRHLSFINGIKTVGEGYAGDAVGYVPRRNYYRIEPSLNAIFYPKSSSINSYSIGIDGVVFWQRGTLRQTDYDFSPILLNVFFKNNARFSIFPLRWDYTYLQSPFDPTNTNGKKLPTNTGYTYRSSRYSLQTDTRKPFSFLLLGRFGEYFNGSINSIQATATYRWQPYGLFSLDVNYNKIDLPTGYNDRQLLLIGPKFDLSFSRSIFFSTFIQYNNQINNVNLNARFQWRFAPVSDLFIVYTDNYYAESDILSRYQAFDSKNRALVLKCTYWLNL
jgi:Domain of unknown function (DUF5916)